jgi:hypothetical protein
MQNLNKTEAYNLCKAVGITASPATKKEWLIGYALGVYECPTTAVNTIDDWRHAIIGFALSYWSKMHPQLKCPLRDLKDAEHPSKGCFECCDITVLSCVEDQKPNENTIRLYMPRRSK